MKRSRDEVGNRLWQRGQFLKHALRQFLDVARRQSPLLHLLGSGVVGLQSHAGEFQRICTIDVGMGDVDAVVEDGRFAEYHVFRAYLIILLDVFAALEPHEVGNACAIREMGYHTLFPRPHLESLETENMSHDLHKRHVASQFMDGIDL